MNDNEIIKLYFSRDVRAIEETSRKYSAYIKSLAFNILNNNEDAEECINDALNRIWNTIPPKSPKNLGTYIGKIVRNLSIDRYRKNTAERRGGGNVNRILDELSECVLSNENVENILEGKELTQYINCFLKNLGQKKRNLFVLRYWYAMDISEIATRTGIGKNRVYVILYRLRNELREYLCERGYFV